MQVLLLRRPRIAFAGGVDCNDHGRVWAMRGKVRDKHPNGFSSMGRSQESRVNRGLLDRESESRADRLQARRDPAQGRRVLQKNNNLTLAVPPIGVIVFPGSDIVENLADKARKMGNPVWSFTQGARERDLISVSWCPEASPRSALPALNCGR